LKRNSGAETRSFVKNQKLSFYDDYCVPSGAVIAILFPKNYIPDIIKFKDKPYIQVGMAGQVTTNPPGQIQILYNHLEKRCSIIFNIHHHIAFGFKCIAKLVSDSDFPRYENFLEDDLFDTTLSREFLDTPAITTDYLKIINQTFNQVDLVSLQETLNELLNVVKTGESSNKKSLLDKLEALLTNTAGTASNLITIADSYKSGASAHQFIGRVLEFISL